MAKEDHEVLQTVACDPGLIARDADPTTEGQSHLAHADVEVLDVGPAGDQQDRPGTKLVDLVGHGGKRDHHSSTLLREVLRHPSKVGHVSTTLRGLTPLSSTSFIDRRVDETAVDGRTLLLSEGNPRVDARLREMESRLKLLYAMLRTHRHKNHSNQS